MADANNPGGVDSGAMLRRARRIARVSQRELADRSGVPAATIARIESGATRDPRVGILAAILAGVGFRLELVTAEGVEIAAHPWERDRDFGDRHYPAHLDLHPVNRPYMGPGDWQFPFAAARSSQW